MNKLDEAALNYAQNHSAAPDKETPDWIIADFKAGVTSDAAKEYWFTKFQLEMERWQHTKSAQPKQVISDEEIEKLAEDYTQKNWVWVGYGNKQSFIKGFKSALQYTKPVWVKASERLPFQINLTIVGRRISDKYGDRVFNIECTDDKIWVGLYNNWYSRKSCPEDWEWLDESAL